MWGDRALLHCKTTLLGETVVECYFNDNEPGVAQFIYQFERFFFELRRRVVCHFIKIEKDTMNRVYFISLNYESLIKGSTLSIWF